MKFTIKDNERALLIKDGRVTKWLEPGTHRIFSLFAKNVDVKRIDLDENLRALTPELERVMPDGVGQKLVVSADQVATVRVDGRPFRVLKPGKYVLWQERAKVTATLYGTEALESDIPRTFWAYVPRTDFIDLEVQPYQRALVYVDGELAKVYGRGRRLLSHRDREVMIEWSDVREQELQIVGQEVMTNDKVSLRINVIAKYRVTDAVAAHEAVANLRDALYAETQMAARQFVAGLTVEQMLERRNDAVDQMTEMVSPRAGDWGVEVLRIELKDVILPGDMKLILNRVIEAEKRAEANSIMRREETAATRSLANTAKMLEKNPTLMRLKELEALKDIVGEIDNVTVVAGDGKGLDFLKLT